MIIQVSIHFRVLYRIVCFLLYMHLVCFLFYCLICTFLLPYMHIYHVYAIALRGGNTTPSFVADALLSSVSRSQVYARDC
jgi:hypothetical protein